jgi:uncharacterized membrane protein YkoI
MSIKRLLLSFMTMPFLINQLTAKNITLNISNGSLVTVTYMIEDNGMIKYEISIAKQDQDFKVNLDAKTGETLKFDQRIKGEI